MPVVPLRAGSPVNPRQQQQQLDLLFPTIDLTKWQGRRPPPREWMVSDMFAAGTVGMISGDGKVGKSLLAQTLCTCAVMGYPWLSRRTRMGRAVYFGCEDDEDELWRRQERICHHLGIEISDAEDAGLILSAREGRDNILSEIDRFTWKMRPTDLAGAVAKRCVDLGVSYLVIDTVARTFGGRTMDAQHVIQFVSQMHQIARLISGVVILINHPSMTGHTTGTGESGSRQWRNAVRSFVYMHKDKKLGLVLDQRGSNYSKSDSQILLEWRDGVIVEREPEVARNWAAD